MALDLDWAPAWRIASAVKSGETSALAAVEASLARIEKLNTKVNAFTSVVADRARKRRRQSTQIMQAERRRSPAFRSPSKICST